MKGHRGDNVDSDFQSSSAVNIWSQEEQKIEIIYLRNFSNSLECGNLQSGLDKRAV